MPLRKFDRTRHKNFRIHNLALQRGVKERLLTGQHRVHGGIRLGACEKGLDLGEVAPEASGGGGLDHFFHALSIHPPESPVNPLLPTNLDQCSVGYIRAARTPPLRQGYEDQPHQNEVRHPRHDPICHNPHPSAPR